ncbi:MAG: hypothetical protein AABX53_01560 [Nanoarchaeota archaeon]
MTNITLSIDDNVYKKMRKYSEIKWSEFVRKIIEQRLNELEKIEKEDDEGVLTMLASEKVLKKEWDNEYDERWNHL